MIQNKPIHTQSSLVIGLTGGIGSGKTVASDWFAEQGIDIIDADVIAKQIVEIGSTVLIKMQQTFGKWIITETGELNRKKLREYVFSNPSALQQLESITHPAIRSKVIKQLNESTSSYTILSAPLLLEYGEKGLVSLCDKVIVIDVSEETQLNRASRRDGTTLEGIKKIMTNQLSRQKRCSQADYIINNDDSVESLYERLSQLHHTLITLTK